jgi:hypothetical protein
LPIQAKKSLLPQNYRNLFLLDTAGTINFITTASGRFNQKPETS